MDFDLTEDQLMLQQSMRDFVDTEFTEAYLQDLEKDHKRRWIDDKMWGKLAELGILAKSIPEQYGGLGGNIIDSSIIMEELARKSGSIGLCYMTATCFGSNTLSRIGSEEQKRLYLPKLATGDLKVCLGLTEPGGGTDVLGAMSTTAVAEGDDYIINGLKTFISGAHIANIIITVAITDRNAPKRTRGISLFLVDSNSRGLEVKPINKLPARAAGANEVFYTDVRVPKSSILGRLNNGWYDLLSTLNEERILFSSLAVGLAQGAFEETLKYAQSRHAFNKPIGQFQVIQHRLVDMAVGIELGRLMMHKAAWLLSVGKSCDLEATVAKIHCSEVAVETVLNCTQIFGGVSVADETPIQRYYRDILGVTIGPISNEMARNYLGARMGLPRSF